MKAKGKFISFLLIVDTFLGSYYLGVHGKQVLVVDPLMKPSPIESAVDKKDADTNAKAPPADKPADDKKAASNGKSGDKNKQSTTAKPSSAKAVKSDSAAKKKTTSSVKKAKSTHGKTKKPEPHSTRTSAGK